MSEIVKESPPAEKKTDDNESEEIPEHDPHYDPIISLPEVEVPTFEEDETVMLCLSIKVALLNKPQGNYNLNDPMQLKSEVQEYKPKPSQPSQLGRAKIYRYDSNETPPEWKERGTGNVKILHHKLNKTVRVVMRRDKTLKLCANHFITSFMTLKPSASCERAWVYSAKDFSDATVKTELLAIKFASIDNAIKWKEAFEEAKTIVSEKGNKKDATLEDKFTSSDSPSLNDSFEENIKNSNSDKEKKNDLSSPVKQNSSEITEKLFSMNIKETKES